MSSLRGSLQHRFRDEDEVMSREWIGGPLANMLNSDSSLNSNLSTELRLDGPLGNIEIVSEPAYGCVRIITEVVSKGFDLFGLNESIPRLPAWSSLDCLDRIAGHVIEIAEL